jgi:FMN phosphatase YigB (HAD superfamily)
MLSTQFDKSNIRAVFFDFDGTLRFNNPQAHHFFFDRAVELGAKDSTMNRRSASQWAHRYWNGKGEVVDDSERYGYDTDEFWLSYAEKYLQAFNCSKDMSVNLAPEVREHMREHYEPENVIEPETPEVLEALRQHGLVLAVVSNRDKPYDELLESLGLARFFDFSLAAGEVNSWKPTIILLTLSVHERLD